MCYCLVDPSIQFRDPSLLGADETGDGISLNPDLYTQVFLARYQDYTTAWLDLIESRPDDVYQTTSYVYTDDIMFLPKKYHACYQENRE